MGCWGGVGGGGGGATGVGETTVVVITGGGVGGEETDVLTWDKGSSAVVVGRLFSFLISSACLLTANLVFKLGLVGLFSSVSTVSTVDIVSGVGV